MRRVLGHYIAAYWLLLGAFEAALIAASCALALAFIFSGSDFSLGRLTAFAIVIALGVVALMHSGGLYRGDAVLNWKRTVWRAAAITLPVFLLAVWTTGVLAHHTQVRIYPYRWQWTGGLTAGWLLSAVVLRLVLREVHRSGVLTRRVVILGTAGHAAELRAIARESDERFRIVAQFDPRMDGVDNSMEAFLQRDLRSGLPEIVVAIDREPLPWVQLARWRLTGIRITDYLDFYEREARRIRIDSLREEWIALSEGFGGDGRNGGMRRLLDVVFALVGLVASAPVLLFSALAIKLEDGGPVLFRQERVGLAGRSFTLLKFRSMREDAEIDGRPAWASEGDTRVTYVGRIIRKLRIDELPQFWNVLRGDMTLIGPRPERPYFVQQFSKSIPFYDYRHAVRPGITGWAQVSFRYGASVEDTRRKLSYDLYYIKNRGFLLDLMILLKTIGVVVRGEGAR